MTYRPNAEDLTVDLRALDLDDLTQVFNQAQDEFRWSGVTLEQAFALAYEERILTELDVDSSNIAEATYDPANQTMDVTFGGAGAEYRYHDVDASEWAGFRKASSKGRYVNEVIKAHSFSRI